MPATKAPHSNAAPSTKLKRRAPKEAATESRDTAAADSGLELASPPLVEDKDYPAPATFSKY